MSVSLINPFYIDTFMSEFSTLTNEDITCFCYDCEPSQFFRASDTLNFQTSGGGNRVDIIMPDGSVDTFVSGSLIDPHNYSIPLAPYVGMNISVRVYSAPASATDSTSFPIAIVPDDSNCVRCSILLEYAGRCTEFGVYYGADPDNPDFTHGIRIPGIFSHSATYSHDEYRNWSNGQWENCRTIVDHTYTFRSDFVPMYMRRILERAFASSYVSIDGTFFRATDSIRTTESKPSNNSYERFEISLKKVEYDLVLSCC